jgi:hypothetical protein
MCSKKGGKQENCLFPPIKIRSFEGVKSLIHPKSPTLFLTEGVTRPNHPFPPTKPARILHESPGNRQAVVKKQVVARAPGDAAIAEPGFTSSRRPCGWPGR